MQNEEVPKLASPSRDAIGQRPNVFNVHVYHIPELQCEIVRWDKARTCHQETAEGEYALTE